MTEKSLVGVYLIQGGIFKYANPRFAEIFGYSIDEITGKIGPKDLTFHEDLHITEENIWKIWNLLKRPLKLPDSKSIMPGIVKMHWNMH